MQPLNPFKQTEGLCGPASLKILLSHYGKDFTEEELAGLCDSTVESGTNHQGIRDALVSLGLHPLEKEGATIEELRELIDEEIPVLVGWTKDGEDHYSVVYAVDETSVSMMDPEEDLGKATLEMNEFEKAWHDFDSGTQRDTTHWLIAVSSIR